MVLNYISHDIDLVQPTQYPNPQNRVAKKYHRQPTNRYLLQPLRHGRMIDRLQMHLADWCARSTTLKDAFINARDNTCNRNFQKFRVVFKDLPSLLR